MTRRKPNPQPTEPPPWLVRLCAKLHDLRHPTRLASAGADYAKGAEVGHLLAGLQIQAEKPPEGVKRVGLIDPRIDAVMTESRDHLARQAAHAARLPRDRAHKFFKGLADALDPARQPDQPEPLTEDIYNVMLRHWSAIDRLPTQAAIAAFVIAHLPPHRRASRAVVDALPARIAKICHRFGLRPARRGRPSKG
jgi:hypothetical protein